jgi:hypothetical protein
MAWKVGEITAGAFVGITGSTNGFYLNQSYLDVRDHRPKGFTMTSELRVQ